MLWHPRVILVAGTALGVTLLLLVLHQMDSGAVWQELLQIEPRRVVVVLAATLVIQFMRPARWWWMFPRAERPGFATCYGVLAISNMVNFIVPGRGGELLRWLLISHRAAGPRRSTAFATLGVEKLLDAFAVLAIVNVTLLGAPVPRWLTGATATISVLLLVAFVAVIMLRSESAWFSRLIQWMTAIIPGKRLRDAVQRSAVALPRALRAVTSRGALVGLCVMTAIIWAGQAVGLALLAWAMQTPLSFADALMVIGIVSLGTLVPSAPGFIGTWEFFAVAALGLAGVDLQPAIALSLVMHGWAFVVAMARGVVSMAMSGFSMSQLTDELHHVETG